jgi:hypothetical protein
MLQHIVVQDLKDGGANGLGIVVVVDEGVIQEPLIVGPAREAREGRLEAFVAFDECGYRPVVPQLRAVVFRLLPGHLGGPEVDHVDHVVERLTQRLVSNIKRLIELRVGQLAAQLQELRRGPTIVSQHAIKLIHPRASTSGRRAAAVRRFRGLRAEYASAYL